MEHKSNFPHFEVKIKTMEGKQLELFTPILDDTEGEVLSFRYEITSYGADYPVDSLVKRLKKGSIFVPPFQRRFVWNKEEASKFIESLLLGLPVPGIFMSQEKEEKKLLIVDGQQRLLTLKYFYDKLFKDGTVFKLVNVQKDLEGKTYDDLDVPDQNRLDDSIIHSTVIKQDEPDDGDSSIYQIFERINSGGRPLSPQEIRACIYYGRYNELLSNLAVANKDWRNVIGGNHNDRLKEEELILRYFSLLLEMTNYKKPMKGFLNNCMANNRDLEKYPEKELLSLFEPTILFINSALGSKAFRVQRGIHSAVFDSVMIATTIRLKSGAINSVSNYVETYNKLLSNTLYKKYYTSGTSDENSVEKRIEIATKKFSTIK